MIESFRDSWLLDFFVRNRASKPLPADIASRLFRKLQILDDATTDADLRAPPGNHFEKLSGVLEGYRSIRINERWRLIFRWDSTSGKATDVFLDDHSYRG